MEQQQPSRVSIRDTRVVEAISVTGWARFADWIRSLAIPDAISIGDHLLYLDVAHGNYRIPYPRSKECQKPMSCTSSADDSDPALMLGTRTRSGHLGSYRLESSPEQADIRMVKGQSMIDSRDTVTAIDVPFLAQHAHSYQDLATSSALSCQGIDHPMSTYCIRGRDRQHPS